MKRSIAALVLLAASLMASEALALDANLSWTANTEADLSWYRLYRATGTCAAPGTFVMVRQVNKTATLHPTSTTDPLPAGDATYCYRLTAGDTSNNESVPSLPVQLLVNQDPPGAPQGFRATVGQ